MLHLPQMPYCPHVSTQGTAQMANLILTGLTVPRVCHTQIKHTLSHRGGLKLDFRQVTVLNWASVLSQSEIYFLLFKSPCPKCKVE